MSNCNKKIEDLLASEAFSSFNCLAPKNLAAIHAIMDLLIASNISFTVSFTSAAENRAANFVITLFISPTVIISRTFQLEEGVI